MKKRIAIIGSGVSGMTSAIYLLEKGYHVDVYEKNSFAGGCCGAEPLDGLYFDHCIHWLIGTKEGTYFNNAWKRIGAFKDDTKFIELGDVVSIKYDGVIYRIQRDREATINEWLKQSPEDEEVILLTNKHMKAVQKLTQQIKKQSDKHFSSVTKYYKEISKITSLRSIHKALKLSRNDLALKFKNEGLRRLITYAQNGFCSWVFFLFEYAYISEGNANVPEGGSRQFYSNILEKFTSLGGKLHLDSPVLRIDVHNKKIASLILQNGEKVKADFYISACSPSHLINDILERRYNYPSYEKLQNKEENESIVTAYQINYRIKFDASKFPVPFGIGLEHPIRVGTRDIDTFFVRHYCYDKKTFENNGTFPVTVLMDLGKEDYYFFRNISTEQYQKEKRRIGKQIMAEIEKHVPEFKGNIEYIDSFTPTTLNRLFSTPFGGYMSYSFSNGKLPSILPIKIQGIDNLSIGGVWTFTPGGLPTAFLSGVRAGRYADKYINHLEEKNKKD